METNPEWIEDNVQMGNHNVPVSYLRLAIKKHALLSKAEKRALLKGLNSLHSRLLGLTTQRTFKDDLE